MTHHVLKSRGAEARDAAFADLIAMESRRRYLDQQARSGDEAAARQLSSLRPLLAKQAVLATDLDRAADLDRAEDIRGCEEVPQTGACDEGQAARLRTLCAERLALARRIESHVGAVAELCHRMSGLSEAAAGEVGHFPPVSAEFNRFREQFCFYLEGMFDFMTGAKGIAGHPSYRKLSEVLLDDEAILKLYRRAVGASGAAANGHRDGRRIE